MSPHPLWVGSQYKICLQLMPGDLEPFKTIWQAMSRRCWHVKICHCQDLSLQRALLHCWVVCPVINEISLPFLSGWKTQCWSASNPRNTVLNNKIDVASFDSVLAVQFCSFPSSEWLHRPGWEKGSVGTCWGCRAVWGWWVPGLGFPSAAFRDSRGGALCAVGQLHPQLCV